MGPIHIHIHIHHPTLHPQLSRAMTNDTLASAKLKRVCLFRTSQYECLTSYPSEIISRQALSGPPLGSLTSLTAVTHNLLPVLMTKAS
ncbi:hypothetical protein ACSS6W_004123 [Trichoderma asperelloides]